MSESLNPEALAAYRSIDELAAKVKNDDLKAFLEYSHLSSLTTS